MLETPLYGRFLGENKKLLFAPTGPYYTLVRACIVGGFAGAVIGGLLAPLLHIELPFYPEWWFYTGVAVGLAGTLGLYSLHTIVFDLREGVYRRREGGGVGPLLSTSRGKLSDLDALVLIAEPNQRIMVGGVTYHLVLHWKNQKEPPVVLQQETRSVPPGQPLGIGGAFLLQVGVKYANALGVKFYDNSHFPSTNPVSILRARI